MRILLAIIMAGCSNQYLYEHTSDTESCKISVSSQREFDRVIANVDKNCAINGNATGVTTNTDALQTTKSVFDTVTRILETAK